MPSQLRSRSLLRTCVRVALLALLSPVAALAFDPAQLAPATPEKPWVIPSPAEAVRRLAESDNLPGSSAARADARMAALIERDHRYDLAELIDLAQRLNPETHEAWEQARQAALAVGLVQSSYAPQVSIEAIVGFQRTPGPIPTTVVPRGYFIANTAEAIPVLALKWLLFDFGRRDGQDQAARANSFAANVAFTGAHQKLVFVVSRAYFALGAARGRLSAARDALKTAETVQDAAQSRRDNGLGTVVSLAQAQRQTAQARLNLTKASGDERTAYANLVASIGLPADTQIDIADSSEKPLPAEPPENLSAAIQDALASRPDVIAALGKIEAAEGTLKTQRAAYYPTIALSAQVYQNMGSLSTDGSPYYSVNKPGGNILLTLSWPLFDGGARDYRVAAARSEVAAARDKLAQVRDAAAQQVVSAYSDLRTSLSAHAAAMTLHQAAQTAYDAAFDAYLHGVGTYTDVASEQTALASADADKEDAHANVFTAAASLAFATGTIQTSSSGASKP
jgi:outer membrane protein